MRMLMKSNHEGCSSTDGSNKSKVIQLAWHHRKKQDEIISKAMEGLQVVEERLKNQCRSYKRRLYNSIKNLDKEVNHLNEEQLLAAGEKVDHFTESLETVERKLLAIQDSLDCLEAFNE